MRQWPALFIKDFKLTRAAFLIGLVMNVLIVILTFYIERVTQDSLLVFIPLAIAAAAHVVYIPMIVLISLKSEGNHLSLWLNNPQPAANLLLSKLANGLLMIVISLVLLFGLSGLLIIPEFSLIEPYWADTWRLGLFIFPHIIWISLALCTGAMALWALYQYLKLRIGRFSLAVVAGTAILMGGLHALLKASKPYQFFTEWGVIPYAFPSIFSEPLPTYTGEYIYDLILIVGFFILTAWLVDNKVEG